LVECWAHQGPAKPAQRHKVAADALKLLAVAATLPTRPRLILCLSDREAAHQFTTARSWIAHALRSLGVEVEVVELPPEVAGRVREAQKRQSGGNVTRESPAEDSAIDGFQPNSRSVG
jgi:hypothetical protein